MSSKRFITALSCALLISGTALAEAPAGLEELPAPLPPPDAVEHDEQMEPEVTIIQREDATVTEYRINGRLYMAKVTPVVGKPYYLVDNNGDGLMDKKMSDVYNPMRVPQWVIFSW